MKRSEVIKGLIEKSGMSQRAFSEKAGLPYTTLRSILERGVGNASVVNVLKICKALGVTFEELEKMASSEDLKPEIQALAAHHDGEEWTEEELEDLNAFKEMILKRRSRKKEQ